jgi:hypothetical protein
MSVFTPREELSTPSRLSPRPQNATADDAVLRATGVIALLAIGAIHFLQIVSTWETTPLLGVAFLALTVVAVAIAARLATHNEYRTWVASAVVGAAAISGYAFTRVFGTPLDRQDVGNWSCMLGLAALFVEATVLVIGANATIAAGALQPRRAAPRLALRARERAADNPSAA